MLERSGNPLRYFYVEFSILVKQFANLIWLQTCLKNQHRLKREFVACLNIRVIRLPQNSFFYISTSVTICVCVFLISFRLSKRIQKYCVMFCVFNQEWLGETINPVFILGKTVERSKKSSLLLLSTVVCIE